MQKILLCLAFLIIISGCDSTPEEYFDRDNTDSEVLKDSADIAEDFMPFFEQFREDADFQVEHVQFPYKVEIWELGAEKPEIDKVFKDEWEHLRFQYDSSFATRKTDAYRQEIKSYGDTVRIELRGIDNGIMIDYEFVKLEGEWKLIAEKDYSG